MGAGASRFVITSLVRRANVRLHPPPMFFARLFEGGIALDYTIRPIQEQEIALLDDFLLEAIYIPPWYTQKISKDVLTSDSKLRAAIEDFGTMPDDHALVALMKGRVVGAVWARIADTYGRVDVQTPCLCISLYKAYRGKGVGTALMTRMLARLQAKGYEKVSLSVDEANPAVRLYQKLGFQDAGRVDEPTERLMVCPLNQTHRSG